MILEKKHINRKKSYTPDGITDFKINSKTDDDEWSRFEPSVGEKIISEEIFEVPNRAITFDRKNFLENKEQEFNERSVEFKDDFINTAQYLKFINAHLAEKKNHFDKMVADKEQFSDDIAALNPKLLTKEQLDRKNYTKLKSDDTYHAKQISIDDKHHDEINLNEIINNPNANCCPMRPVDFVIVKIIHAYQH